MATISSVVSGSSVVYTITDAQGDTMTITAPPAPSAITFSGSTLAQDGQQLLTTLMQLLSTGLRPNVIINTPASFSN